MKKYNVQFPPIDSSTLGQDEVYFYLIRDGYKEKILFHDYDRIYKHPGLYEQLFYDRLKCTSPRKITESLSHILEVNHHHFSEMKVLDFGAGNGMMGEELKRIGVARLVGADIIEEARDGTYRDRPGLYDEYFIKDFTRLTDVDKEEIRSWGLNAMTTVAALGFGDIPAQAFVQAVNLIEAEGWVAFNIKESFLWNGDTTGFSRLIRELVFSEVLKINHLERYRHRLSMEGNPLYYFSVVCWKTGHIDEDWARTLAAA